MCAGSAAAEGKKRSMDHFNNIRCKKVDDLNFVMAAFPSLSSEPPPPKSSPSRCCVTVLHSLSLQRLCVFVHTSTVHRGKFV